MSDDGKDFAPTPSRLAQARREGNVARSQEFGANLAFIVAIAALGGIAAPFGALARSTIADAARGTISGTSLFIMLLLALAPMAAAACAGACASLLQTGGLLVVAPSIKLSRLSPVEGFKRMFSREAVAHGVRALLAFALATAAVSVSVREIFAVATGSAGVGATAQSAWNGAVRSAAIVGAIGLLFGGFEYGIARHAWLRKLRMSLEELKRDIKEHDGDPAQRGRRKSLHRAMIRGALAKVDEASFVVVNPTHVAVALEYRPPQVAVPRVLVRAADEMALRVRERAGERKIPVIENIPLARALFADARVGDPIPADHFVAVAEIVAALVRSGVLHS